MASAFTHGIAAAALAPLAPKGVSPLRLGVALAALSMAPDLDVVGFRLGVPYASGFGHRGFTHSLVFALACGVATGFVFVPRALSTVDGRRPALGAWARVAALATLATASHGLLDALTDAGHGVAFFWPWDTERYFWPWRPLLTSPLSVRAFFSGRGLEILANEARWIWGPALALGAVLLWRRLARRR